MARWTGGWLVMLALWLCGCDRTPSLERISGPTMGSTYTVQYVRTAQGPAPEQVRFAVEAVLQQIDHTFSTYRSDSLIAQFNRLPANSCQAMPADVLQLVQLGEQL